MDLWYEFFVKPIETYSGYNIVNTLVYAIILLAIAFFIVYPLFKRFKVQFNFQFALGLLPYILLGISVRIFEDLRILPRSANPLEPGYYLISPGIWIFIGLLTIFALLFSVLLAKKVKQPYLKIFGIIGLVLCIPAVLTALLQFTEWLGFFLVLFTATALTLAAIKLSSLKNKILESNLNRLTLFGQTLDGAATFIATSLFACGEQHVLPRAIIDFYPPLFLLVKIVLVYAILYYLDKHIEDKNFSGFIKVIILVLGFSTGLRDLFTLAAGTCGSLF